MRRLLHWLALCLPLIVIPPTIYGQQNQSARKAVDLQELTKFKQFTQKETLEKLDDKQLVYLQFSKVPDQKQLSAMAAKGIKVLSYLNDKTYLIALPLHTSMKELQALGVLTFAPTDKEQKKAAVFHNNDFPAHAITSDNRLKVAINFHPGFDKNRYYELLEQYDVEIMEDGYGAGNIFTLIVHPIDIDLLAGESLVAFIDVVTPPVEMLNNEVRSLQKVTYANAANGFGLHGSGVVVGIGDGGELGSHLDFEDRVINYANGTYSSFGDHGDHVAGIVGGAGLVNPRHRGMASEATLLIQKTSLITYYAQDYFDNHEMVLTNNSYGTSFNCSTNGSYNYTSQTLDLQLREVPEMLHVFAAGNSGTQTCSPYPAGFFTLLRYYQSAKNVLTVGNVTDTREIKNNSSRGPASDGRLKPELCGIGTSVTSTGRNYDYTTKSGTSMASPAVTGTLALMYEGYRNQYGGNPSGALIKAMACNTADDLGNAGPDYTFGYGLINVRRAVQGIQDGAFIEHSISDGGSASHTITVPANTKQVKVMLYWADKEADPYPTKALVNDLDLVLTSFGGTSYLPWVLNPTAANVNDPATRQADHLNNIEQVTIDNPAAGTYTISVTGTEVPYGPQDYVVVYEFVTDDVVVTHPMGGEHFGFSDSEVIQWDTDNNNTSTFTVEYSLDGGSSWNVINNNVAATERSLFWTVPSTTSDNAFIRVTKNTGGSNDSNATSFSIFGTPQLLASPACEGMVALEWGAVDGIDYYEIQKFDGTTIITIDTTTSIEFLVEAGDMVLGEQYWFAVKGKTYGGKETARSTAQSCITTDDASCNWSDDVVAEAISVPTKGRVGTSSKFGTDEVISLTVKNIGDNEVSGIDLSYQVNGGAIVTESYSQAIASGQTITYAFEQKVDMSAVGTYSIDAWVTFANDVDNSNNSIIGSHVSEQLENLPVDLSSGPISYDFNLSGSYTYTADEIGLTELECWDFETTVDGTLVAGTTNGVELLIDETAESIDANYSNNAIYTVNLTNHDPADGLVLSFVYANNNLFPLESGDQLLNKVFVRGSDTDVWIEAYTMPSNLTGWQTVGGINLITLLDAEGQSLTSSFQIRFEENGKGLLLDQVNLGDAQSLPVELITFSATKIDGDALLKWKTASELNNKQFEVQVATSTDAVQKGDFTTLATVPGLGTSTEPMIYSYLDITPDKNGTYYYRLKQVDFDGKFEFSEIRQLNFMGGDYNVEIFPNPFTEYVLIGNDQSTFSNVTGQLYNAFGQLVDIFNIPASGHSGTYRFDIKKDLPGGLYYLHMQSDGQPAKAFVLMKAE